MQVDQKKMVEGNHVYQIGGVEVEFPYKAYGPQLAYMGRIITTLEKAFSNPESHCNALLESPTGSGKSLALLCAALAWQQHRKNTLTNPPIGPATQCGGGFIPEDSTQDTEEDRKLMAKKIKTPTVFFATRTHSQISQIVQELRKTVYRVPMAILAARKHYCTNKNVCKKANLDEECNILLKDPGKACPQFKNVYRLRSHSSLQKGGCQEVHDIEDLVSIAHSVRGCAYFASRDMAQSANLVFCPYNYILNPSIRKAMAVDVRGDIIIFDEAHNIEDMSREAGSVDLTVSSLEELRMELETLSSEEGVADIYQPLSEIIQEMLLWVREAGLQQLDEEHYCGSWTGENAVEQLRSFGVSLESFPVLLQCATKAADAASDPDPEKVHLSGRAAAVLEGLFSSLRFMLSKPENKNDYQVVVQKTVQRDEGSEWVVSVSFWCLNPGVVFSEIATTCKSVILTSGTLSPMSSFASELGVAFDVIMEAPHVIDMNSQVSVNTVALGPGNIPLNASYKCASTFSFQDALGAALEQIYKVVPGGALVFLPSYALLDKLCNRWKATGQWNRFLVVKEVFVEPRGKTDNFEHVLDGYYNAITGKSERPSKKRGKSSAAMLPKRNGAAFFAVCRGKVSEGINFSDENARVVIVVGIPFPNVKDMQVSLKKQYNNSYRMSKKLLGGDQWYCQQAFRALNQAVGRCIRHRNDYGAILLMDERFNNSAYVDYMSKWLRRYIKVPQNFDCVLRDLRRFFEEKSLSSSQALNSSAATPPSSAKVAASTTSPCTPSPYQPCFDTLFRKKDSSLRSPKQQARPILDSPTPCQPWKNENLPTNPVNVPPSSTFWGKENIEIQESRVGNMSCETQETYPETQDLQSRCCETFPETQDLPSRCCETQDLARPLGEGEAVHHSTWDTKEPTQFVSRSLQTQVVAATVQAERSQLADFVVPSTLNEAEVPTSSTSSQGSEVVDETLFCTVCGHQVGSSSGCEIRELQKTYLSSLVNKEESSPVKVAFSSTLLHGMQLDNRKTSSVWVEDDGCVFKHVRCGCCRAIVGVRIVAVDQDNMEFVGKVLLLLDVLKPKVQTTPPKKRSSSTIVGRGKLKLRKVDT